MEHVRLFRKSDEPQVVSQHQSGKNDLGVRPLVVACGDAVPPFIPRFERAEYMFKSPVAAIHEDSLIHLNEIRIGNNPISAVGFAVVKNLAFEKHVACRFTLDGWTTQSEVAAEYVYPIRDTDSGRDLFKFTLPLTDYSRIGENELEFCIRYAANGQEFWDNNDSNNYRVSFDIKYQNNGDKRPDGNAKPRTETYGTVHVGEGDKWSKIRRHQKTSGKPLHNSTTREIWSFNSPPLHCTFGQILQIGALAHRYDFSAALTAVGKSGVRRKGEQLVPVMKTGPSIIRGGLGAKGAKPIGSGLMPHAIK